MIVPVQNILAIDNFFFANFYLDALRDKMDYLFYLKLAVMLFSFFFQLPQPPG